MEPLPAEARRSRYHLLGLVGQGQFGQVFCAVDRETKGLVALKTLDLGRNPTPKFLRELRLLLSLHHPNIVECQTLENLARHRSLVLDYWEAGTLRTLMESEHQLSLPLILHLISDVLQGLALAHAQGIVHCDIKPENILLRLEASGWRAGISDFGVARLSQESLKESANDTGSPAYMAPERFYGQYSFASDLYAVGVLLFEMLVGHRPFSGIPGELMAAHLNQPVQIPETIPFILRSTLTTALHKLPQQRFANAAAMIKSIQIATEVEVSCQPSVRIWLPTAENVASADFRSVRQEPLPTPITALGVQGQQIYWISDHQFVGRNYLDQPDIFNGQPRQQWQILFPHRPEQLFITPQGCYILTRSAASKGGNAYALYALPLALAQSGEQINSDELILLTMTGSRLLIDIDPLGKWLAYGLSPWAPQVQPIPLNFLRLPQLSSIPSPINFLDCSAVKTWNHRYGVAITTNPSEQNPGSGCQLQIFNRRGDPLISYPLPTGLKCLTPSQTLASQGLGIERSDCPQGLLINFKPWQVQRIPLAFEPDFVLSACWGYLLANQQGALELLNPLGQKIARLQTPGRISAIATFGVSGLLIATWESGTGMLFTVDLRELNLDLLF
jgi:serine/threonine protein kinase